MDWTPIAAGLSLSWDTETDDAFILCNTELCPFAETDGAINEPALLAHLQRCVGRTASLQAWASVNEGQPEVIAIVRWQELTPQQRYAITAIAWQTAQLFVEEWHTALDPAVTDWDGTAWCEDSRALPFAGGLQGSLEQEAFDLYQSTLVAVTIALCAA